MSLHADQNPVQLVMNDFNPTREIAGNEMFEPEWNKDEMKYFDENHEGGIINTMAAGMSQDEVCNFFGVTVKNLSGEDLAFFKYHYRMGRADANNKAVSSLFKQMDQRGGGQVALSYLIRFGDNWEEKPQGDIEQSGKKSFRIIMD